MYIQSQNLFLWPFTEPMVDGRQPKRTYKIHAYFSDHCFTRDPLPGEAAEEGRFNLILKESLIFKGGDSDPMQRLMLQMMGAFAEFERSVIRERQKEGIAKAKQRGVYKGKPQKFNWNQKIALYEDFQNLDLFSSSNKTELAEKYKISRATMYKYVKEVKTSKMAKG